MIDVHYGALKTTVSWKVNINQSFTHSDTETIYGTIHCGEKSKQHKNECGPYHLTVIAFYSQQTQMLHMST